MDLIGLIGLCRSIKEIIIRLPELVITSFFNGGSANNNLLLILRFILILFLTLQPRSHNFLQPVLTANRHFFLLPMFHPANFAHQ